MNRILHEIEYRIKHAAHHHVAMVQEQQSVICEVIGQEYIDQCPIARILLLIVLITSIIPIITGIFGFTVALHLKKRTRMDKYD